MAVSPVGDHASIDLSIEELQAIFRLAAPKWRCPDEKNLAECPYLTSLGWVATMVAEKPEAPWVPAEREVRKALKALQAELPALLDMYQALSPIRPFGLARLVALRGLEGVLPYALAAVEISYRRKTKAWHDAAALIAYEATEAWQRAGRTEISIRAGSPLVRLVQDILARAGIEVTRGAIADALVGSDRPGNKTQNKDSIRVSSSAAE